jgi:predicted  nucleic acid-binding Zn-ribbon protein
MTEERFDRFEKTMLAQFGIVNERMDRLEARMDGLEVEMSRQFKRVNKRLKRVEDGLVTVQHAIHDLSVEVKKHDKKIDFLTAENLKQSQHLSYLFKQEEHHDNRIAILFERMAVE